MKKYLLLLCIAGQFLWPQSRNDFRFIHISDTHVGSTTGADDLRRTVRDINTLSGIKFIVISGDITEFGSDCQLRLAKSILDSLHTPWYLTPGNHDMKWGGSAGESFKKIFGYERFVFDYNGIRFIGLHQGPRLKMGDGFWAPEDMRWLDSVLTTMDHNAPFFIVTHYPIDDGIANWYEILNRVRNDNIQAFLYGHGHRNRADVSDGIPGVMCRSNLRARDSVGGYSIVTIKNDTMFYQERKPFVGTGPIWDTVALHLAKLDFQKPFVPPPAFTVNDAFPQVKTLWKVSTGYLIGSSPVLWNNMIIVGDASGTVRALRTDDGKEVWKWKANDGIFSSPAVESGRVVFGSTDSTIDCLDARSGSLQWQVHTGAAVVASPAIDHGVAYIGSSDNIFRAIDVRSGSVRWEFDGLNGFVECTPTIADGKVIFGAWDECLYCLDQSTGALVWKWEGGTKGTLYSPAACQPVVEDGKVFIAAPDRYLTAIDLQTGATVWRTNEFQVRETIGGSSDGKRVYIRTMNDSLYALSSQASEPAVVWKLDAGFGYDINSAMIVEKEGVVFYPTKNGLLLAVDGTSGKLLWKHKTGVGVTNTPLALSNKNVVITDFQGTVQVVTTEMK